MAWSSGTVLTAGAMNLYVPQTWTAYTPTIANMPTSSVVGAYVAHGKTVHVKVHAVTSGAVTGPITIALPAVASSRFGLSGYAALLEGNVTAVDTGANSVTGYMQLATATTISLFSTAAASVGWNATIPHIWAATDILVAAFTYEAA